MNETTTEEVNIHQNFLHSAQDHQSPGQESSNGDTGQFTFTIRFFLFKSQPQHNGSLCRNRKYAAQFSWLASNSEISKILFSISQFLEANTFTCFRQLMQLLNSWAVTSLLSEGIDSDWLTVHSVLNLSIMSRCMEHSGGISKTLRSAVKYVWTTYSHSRIPFSRPPRKSLSPKLLPVTACESTHTYNY